MPHPWDSPGKNAGVGCHFLLQCVQVKSESEVAQSCPTLSDPMDCSLPGSSIHGIFQARVLECSVVQVVKNPPANARNWRDTGLIPGSGRLLGVGNGNHSSILAWEIPWTYEPGRLQSTGLQRVRHDWGTEHTLLDHRPPTTFLYEACFLQKSLVLFISEGFS